ncbi:tetratricopeptide repeat protein [Rhizobium halophytocola]|uniref:Tetratricopeptide (TPR) repeat protein n=1 Tax=Rhizobium halophytocola TaxID=735519 RepID=A0ABS4DXK4_9HYPH|nr:tetratricopeptide repeat protein [Rhizobium halophytocola]MBP1850407.1 tetratricopeptide (TPR) repeat protein [Rhizobium halophytocola]
MRQTLANRFLSGAALATLLMAGVHSTALAATSAEDSKAHVEKPFDMSTIDTFSGAFLAARTADGDRDFPNAIGFYKKALAFEPGRVDVRERLMLALFMNGDFDEGVRYAKDLKNDKAVERVTGVARGLAAIRDREYNAADKALDYKGPNDLDRLMNALLSAWAELGASKGKQAVARMAGLKGPPWYDIFKNYNAGVAANLIGDTDGARKYLADAITDRDGAATATDLFVRSVMALATLESNQGNKQKALDALSVGENALNNYAPFKAMRTSINAGEKLPPLITTAAEGAAGVLFGVGGALNRPGAEDTVMLYLQFARALDPKSADMLILLGGIAENVGQEDKAVTYYRDVPKTSPMSRLSEMQLGLTLAKGGNLDEARQHLKALVEADPTDLRSYLAYGSVLSDAKDYPAMAKNYDDAVTSIKQPTRSQWSIYFQRGIAYERLKDWPKAEPNFRKALELSPDQPQVLNYLGYSWVDMNRNLKEGLDMIKKAVELKPDDGYIVDSLGWAYYRLGRFDDAVTELERAAELKAGDPTINDHLGDTYWRVGRTLEAVYQWKRALGDEPEAAEIPKIEDKIANGLPPLDKAGETAEKPDDRIAPAGQEGDKKS